MAHLGGDEVFRKLREVGQDRAVADHSHAPDLPVVLAHKAQMGSQRGEPVPTREGLGLDQEAAKPAGTFDEGIDLRRQGLKVVRLQGSLGGRP